MAIDPSIILGTKPLQLDSPLQMAGQAMTLKSLANRNQIEGQSIADDQATRSAIKNNMTVGPDGQPAVDRQATLRDLFQAAPQKAMELQTNWRQQDMAQQAAQLKQMQDQAAMKVQLMSGVTDQASWSAAKQQGIRMGIPGTDRLPDAYDPTIQQSIITHNMAYKDQLEQMNKQQDFGIRSKEVNIKEQDLALQRQKLYGGSGQGPAMPGNGQAVDPATLVPSRVPEARQAKSLEEIKDLQNVVSVAKPSLEAFDQAAKEVRPMTGGTGTSLTAFVPGMESPAQKAWQGLANTTVKDVEGTARQAAFDSLAHNFKPQFGDSDANIAEKRIGWINYLKSHASAPTSMSAGLDLSKYPSTNIKDLLKDENSKTASKDQGQKKFAWEAK